jgi:SMI1-KNR4 cell-wall
MKFDNIEMACAAVLDILKKYQDKTNPLSALELQKITDFAIRNSIKLGQDYTYFLIHIGSFEINGLCYTGVSSTSYLDLQYKTEDLRSQDKMYDKYLVICSDDTFTYVIDNWMKYHCISTETGVIRESYESLPRLLQDSLRRNGILEMYRAKFIK